MTEDSTSHQNGSPAGGATNSGSKLVDFVKKNVVLLVSVLVVVVLAVIVISSIVSGNSASGIAKKYLKANLSGDLKKADTYNLVSTEDGFEKLAKEADKDLDEYLEENLKCDSMKEYWSDREEDFADQLEEQYGKHVKVTIEKVKDVDEYTNSELKDFRESNEELFDSFDMDVDKVKAVADVEIKAKVKGKDDSETNTVTLKLVKYKGRWKIFGRGGEN